MWCFACVPWALSASVYVLQCLCFDAAKRQYVACAFPPQLVFFLRSRHAALQYERYDHTLGALRDFYLHICLHGRSGQSVVAPLLS